MYWIVQEWSLRTGGLCVEGVFNSDMVRTYVHVWYSVSIVRFYCTSTGPIGGLNCEVLLYFNWSHRWSQL